MEKPTVHVIGPAAKIINDVCDKDRQYFIDHPDENVYRRPYVPGEFVPMPEAWLGEGAPDLVEVRRGPIPGTRIRAAIKLAKK